MIVVFDLPAVTKKDAKEYRKFIRVVKSVGFSQFQESVYTKLCLNESVVAATMKDIKSKLPKEGMISVITMTEKQFASIEHILGEPATDLVVDERKVVKL